MLARRIIPCLDVTGGRVVKGINFVELRDAGDPVEIASAYDRDGADELVFLDITASHEGRDIMLDIVRRTAEQVFTPFTVGGGIRSVEDIREILSAGADKVSINSSAVRDPDLVNRGARRFGSQCIVVAIDAKRSNGSWEVFVNGGRIPVGRDVIEWAKEVVDRGAGEILLTSRACDGTRDGYDTEVPAPAPRAVTAPGRAPGGAGNLEHLYDVLTEGKASAALAASIFHYGQYRIQDARAFLKERGVAVR